MKRVLFVFALLLLPMVRGDLVLANTASWQNVYSAGIFAALQGYDFNFLISQKHSQLILRELPKDGKIIIIESNKTPYVRNYESWLAAKGYAAETIQVSEREGNLELANRLNATKFIVVDPTYGYDAISVAPYATYLNAYVLFADKENIEKVKEYLSEQNVESLLIYGDVDKEVKDTLVGYSPEVLHEGNRFKNNLVLAERYRQDTGAQQVLLSNGEFIEHDLFRGSQVQQPLVFIGRERPPVEVIDYLRTSQYKAMVLIGNELFAAGQAIKEAVKKPLFIKFGKGITGSGNFKDVHGLDLFYVPRIELLLNLVGVFYNTETQNVELVLRNEREAKTYVRSSLIVKNKDQAVQTVGDEEVQQMADFETRAFIYPAELAEYAQENLTAELFIPYGSAEDILEQAITTTVPLQFISEKDKCDVDIKDLSYNVDTQRFEVELSGSDCHARVTIKNLLIDTDKVSVQSGVEKIDGTTSVFIKQPLDEVQRADNPKVTVEIRYGRRAEVLTQVKEKEFPLKLAGQSSLLYPVIIGSLVLIIVLLLLWKRKKK